LTIRADVRALHLGRKPEVTELLSGRVFAAAEDKGYATFQLVLGPEEATAVLMR
jgi:hypothetical protein